MSVLSVAFRLEIADGSPIPQLDFCSKGGTKSYAEAAVGSRKLPAVEGKDLNRFKGQRKFSKFVIETYMADKGKAPTGSPRGSSAPRNEHQKQASTEKETDIDSIAETKTKGSSKKPKGGQGKKSQSAEGTAEEYTISQHLKHDKQPPPLQALAKKASHAEGGASGGKPEGGGRPGSARGPRALSPTPQAIAFSSGNPSVENTEGIVHLYRDDELYPESGEDPPKSEMICFMGVPARMTSHDVIQFLAPVEGWIEHMKVIRDNTPNQYMLLVKFRTPKNAWDFYKNFNNKPFNSVEKDLCRLAFVSRLEAVKSEDGAGLPIAGLVELPTCPVCLERMDESVNGILTVQCNHSFHTACLAHWEDTTCPVCRFAQTPEATGENACFECQSQDSLWICLICGHVGCGRYVAGHAHAHFTETNHTYSMQLNNNRVWDYAGDNYVHRLVQNKSDGKMVEVDERGNVVEDEKLDSIALEYTYLVNAQMESQRLYFEEKIKHIETDYLAQIEELKKKNKQIKEEHEAAQKDLASFNKDVRGKEKKQEKLKENVSKLKSELETEKELNKGLRDKQTNWSQQVNNLEENMKLKEGEIQELREQLRDVMFYLEAGQKLADSTAVSQQEIQEGQVVVGASPTSASKKTRKKGR